MRTSDAVAPPVSARKLPQIGVPAAECFTIRAEEGLPLCDSVASAADGPCPRCQPERAASEAAEAIHGACGLLAAPR